MSLIQAFSNFKDDTLCGLVSPVAMGLGIQAMPATMLLVGEASLSSLFQYGMILPSPIGMELLGFPSRMMIYLLDRRQLMPLVASKLARIFPALKKKSDEENDSGESGLRRI